MAFNITYKPLFQVNILHQYYLNKGTAEYASMNETEKETQLIGYNFSDFFTIQISNENRRKLNGHNMVFKTTNTGFKVWTKVTEANENVPFIAISDSLCLTFLLKLNNTTFFNFSELEFENLDKLFFFSNRRLSTEANNFPLIKKAGTYTTVNSNFVLGNESAEAELEQLTTAEKQNLFGIVKLYMRADTGALHIVTNQNKIQDPFREFDINIANRKTFWRYFFNENQQVNSNDDVKKEDGSAVQLVTRQKQPLTASGFVSIELGGVELPNPDATLVKPNSTNNKIYSEIYM